MYSFVFRLILLLGLALLSCAHPIVNDLVDDNGDELGEAMPVTPKWYNHCKAVSESHHLTNKLSETKSLSIIRELFQKVEKSAQMSLRRAEDIKRKFVDLDTIFNNAEGLRFKFDFKWLPEIPRVSEDLFKDFTKEMALIYAHQYIEKFAVALEQMVIDHNTDQTTGATDSFNFKNIDDDNYSVLCEIRLAMSVVFGSVNEHFITRTVRTIMPEEDRRIGELSKRMVRDYLILRQYVRTTQYLIKLFEYIREYKLISL